MSDLHIRLRDLFEKIKCFFVCCGSRIVIENSEIDGLDDSKNE